MPPAGALTSMAALESFLFTNDVNKRYYKGNTLLLMACFNVNISCTFDIIHRIMDEPGVDIRATCDKGENAVMKLCYVRHYSDAAVDLLTRLLVTGCKPAEANGLSPILRVCNQKIVGDSYHRQRKFRRQIIFLLVTHGASFAESMMRSINFPDPTMLRERHVKAIVKIQRHIADRKASMYKRLLIIKLRQDDINRCLTK
jgi:hypothetical protein